MKKVLIGCTAVILIVVIALVVAGLMLPTDYEIEERITINATPDQVHVFVGDLNRWEEWTPWKEADDSIVVTMGELTTGVGASQTWTGESGEGRLTFTACDPLKGIAYDMAFIADDQEFPAKCTMTYEPAEGGTDVIWTMSGDVDGPPVVSGLVTFIMSKSIGAMFQQGLTTLKTRVEG